MIIELSNSEMKLFTDLAYQHTGITIKEHKKALMSNRLRKRCQALDLKDFSDYYTYLKNPKNLKELDNFIDVVTTNETYFFRSPKIWDWFANEYLPNWYKENKGLTFKMWSGASSSGEEIYNLLILIEEFAKGKPGFNYTVYASDISNEMLEKTKEGCYGDRAVEKVPKNLLKEYFTKNDEGKYIVDSKIKKSMKLFRHNLMEKTKQNNFFDIVFLRNVLIYFQLDDKEKIINNVSESIKSKGFLVTGEAEGLATSNINFEQVSHSIFRKK